MPSPSSPIRVRFYWLAPAVALCGALSLRAAPPNGPAAVEQAKSFAWFGSLDYPDVKTLPFVVATVPNDYEYLRDRYPTQVVAGFLIADNPKEFTVFTLACETRTVAKSVADVPPRERTAYVRANLPEYVHFVIDALQHDAAKRRDRGFSPRFGAPPSDTVELFVLSWASSRKGYDSLAGELFDSVVSLYRIANWSGSPREAIAKQIEQMEFWRAFCSLNDPKLPRRTMLERCQRFARVFPASSDAPRITGFAKILERMVAEDKEYAAKRAHDKPFDKLSKNEQIAELIFQLRDQTGFQPDNYRQSDIFATAASLPNDAPDGGTPAHRLAKYGYDALPQLVDALGDDRLARIVEIRSHSGSEDILTVGDCAERILSRITAHDFYRYGYMHPEGCMSAAGNTAKVKAAVNDWCVDVRRRGEQQVLIEMVEKGGNSDAAVLLAEKHPDAALAPIRVALANSADRPWLPAKFVRAAAKIPGETPIPFLLDRAKNGNALDERLAAAVALVHRKRPEGVATLIAEWGRIDSSDQMFYSLILSMLDSGSADAIGALAKEQPERPDGRSSIVDAIRLNDTANALFGVKRGRRVPATAPLSPEQLQAKDAVVKLLVKSLEDTGQVKGAWTGEFGDKWIPNVRICDIAGRDLNDLDPKKFPFDLEAPLEQREKSRLAIISAYRK